MIEADAFTNAYAEAAIWSSTVEEPGTDELVPMDTYFDVSNLHPETVANMIRDCSQFQEANADDLAAFYVATDKGPEQGGHDLWLTRNGHGAGFWDRGAGEVGERLSDAAAKIGGVELWTDGEYVRD